MELDELTYFTVEQVSAFLQIHWQTTLQYIRKGELKAFKLGKGYRISKQDLEAFIKSRHEKGAK